MKFSPFKSCLFPLLSVFLFTLGSSYFTTFITLFLLQKGHGQTEIGWVHSAYYIGVLLGALLIEKPIRQLGHKWAYTLFAGVGALSLLAHALTSNLIYWGILRFVFGFCIAGFYVIIESLLLSNSQISTRGKVLSFFMVVLYASQMVSHEILCFLDIKTYQPFVFAALLCSLSIFFIFRLTSPSPEMEKPKTGNFMKIYNASPFGFIGCLVSGFIISIVYSLMPSYAACSGFNSSHFMQVVIGGGCLLQFPFGYLSDRFNRSTVQLATALLTAIAALIILLFPSEKTLLYFATFFLGGGSFALYTISVSNVCDHLKSADLTNGNAILLFAYGVGSVLGPFVTAHLMDTISMLSLYFSIAGAAGLVTCVGLFTKKRESSF